MLEKNLYVTPKCEIFKIEQDSVTLPSLQGRQVMLLRLFKEE